MRLILNWIAAACVFAIFAISGSAATPSYAAGTFMSTHSGYHRSCRVNLGGATSIDLVTLQKAMATIPAGCNDICPFDNISQFFFLTRIKGDLRIKCFPFVLPPASLSTTMGGGSVGRVRGGPNLVYIFMDGSHNLVGVFQHGSGDITIALIDGSNNSIVVSQNGLGNVAGIIQLNDGNSLNLTQNGDGNVFIGLQDGGDSLALTQTGSQTTISIQ